MQLAINRWCPVSPRTLLRIHVTYIYHIDTWCPLQQAGNITQLISSAFLSYYYSVLVITYTSSRMLIGPQNDVAGHGREHLFHYIPLSCIPSLQQFIVLMRKLIDIKTTTLGPYYYEVIHSPAAALPYVHLQCMTPFHLHLLQEQCNCWACAMSSFRKHNKTVINFIILGKARTLKSVSYYFMIRFFWVVTSCNLVDGAHRFVEPVTSIV